MPRPYQPIDCDSHDELEALATLRQPCDLIYRDSAGREVLTRDVIEDLYTQNHEEFLKLRNRQMIRLDAIISVNGRPLKSGCIH